jgi:NAD(P)H-dependent FMN reductase
VKIGIVVGSVREGRLGRSVGQWVATQLAERPEVTAEVIDLREFDVPLLTTAVHPAAAGGNYESEGVRRWSAAIDACDAFIFVTAEYNHGVPGAFKNAVDSLAPEWMGKPIGFVSYGADNGVRAVEQWRQIVANFDMPDVRAQVSLSLFTEFDADGLVQPIDRRAEDLSTMVDQLLAKAPAALSR